MALADETMPRKLVQPVRGLNGVYRPVEMPRYESVTPGEANALRAKQQRANQTATTTTRDLGGLAGAGRQGSFSVVSSGLPEESKRMISDIQARADRLEAQRLERYARRSAARDANSLSAARNHAIAQINRATWDDTSGAQKAGLAGQAKLGLLQGNLAPHAGLSSDATGAATDRIALDQTGEIQRAGLAQEGAIAQQKFGLDRAGLDADNTYKSGLLDVAQQNADTARLEATGKGAPLSEYERQLQREQAKLDAKRQQAQVETGRETLPIVDKLSRLEQMTNDSGFWANIGGLVGPTAAGFSDKAEDAATKKQVFDSIASNLVLDAASALKGALSDKDIAFLKETVPKFGNTPEANKQIINNIRGYLNARRAQEGLPPLPSQSDASQPAADTGGQDAINARAAELKAQGKDDDEIMEILDKEF